MLRRCRCPLLLALAVALAFPLVGCGSGGGDAAASKVARPLPEGVAPSASAYVVDLRAPEQFAQRHEAGAINLQWGYGQFELRAKRLFPAGATLELLAADEGTLRDAVTAAHAAGFAATGRTASGGDATLTVLTPNQLAERLEQGQVSVIDTRTAEEYAEGHIPGAVFVYPDDIHRVAPLLAKDRPIAVICQAGWRSSLVASWLARAGHAEVFNVMAGMDGWKDAGLPLETAAQQRAWKD